jgi:hypothetical protein
MSEIKHTPGPWVQIFRKNGPCMDRYIVNDPGDTIAEPIYIATVESETDHARNAYEAPGRSAEANARLIAAAPDGLALAEHILALETDPYLQGHPEWEAFLNEAQALLNKVRGAR